MSFDRGGSQAGSQRFRSAGKVNKISCEVRGQSRGFCKKFSESSAAASYLTTSFVAYVFLLFQVPCTILVKFTSLMLFCKQTTGIIYDVVFSPIDCCNLQVHLQQVSCPIK